MSERRWALRDLSRRAPRVVDEEQQCAELLAAPHDAGTSGLLDGVGVSPPALARPMTLESVPAAGRTTSPAGGLTAENLALRAVLRAQRRRRSPRSEKNQVSPGLGQRLPVLLAEHVRVIGERHRCSANRPVGQAVRRGAGVQKDRVLPLDDIETAAPRPEPAGVYRRWRRPLDVEPLAGDADADVRGFVLVVGLITSIFQPLQKAGILDRELGGDDGTCR